VSGGLARAVFLDRDGVLVVPERRDGRSYAPRRLEDLAFYPDAAPAVARLKAAGFVVIVFTNQPDVGAGLVARETVEAMHERLRREIPVDDIEVSYLTREQARAQADQRRKPGTGMLLDAARRWQLDLGGSYVVGDRASDIEAGTRAGCTSLFIDLG
jgi:D-glycero-D-manno-heptose 1,7-bisphosphate phosphatase